MMIQETEIGDKVGGRVFRESVLFSCRCTGWEPFAPDAESETAQRTELYRSALGRRQLKLEECM